jgi:hypothetical protein
MTASRLLVLLLALASAGAAAQQPVTRLGQSEQTRQNTTGYYFHHLPGEATIQVQVAGAVVYPGLYEVGVQTDLRRVLALAGGPKYDARDRQSDRRVEIRLMRPNVGMIYGGTLFETAANPGAIPALLHDDAVIVDVIERRRLGWQDVATVIGTIGTLAFIVQVASN